jgi:hypothetical protein
VRASILSYDCADLDPIQNWVPDDPYDVDFWMNFTIGPDTKGGDNFQVHIVTPNNLQDKDSDKHAIVVKEYEFSSVLKAVENMLDQSQGENWSEISEKLSKLMYWEFEDYKP